MTAWYAVCPAEQIPRERGVCVLVGGEQVALVRTREDVIYAVGNLDPVSGAMVMSRGIVGSRGQLDVLASPMHKQVYDLSTGRCLDLPGVWLTTHEVRIAGGNVEVGLAEAARRPA